MPTNEFIQWGLTWWIAVEPVDSGGRQAPKKVNNQ